MVFFCLLQHKTSSTRETEAISVLRKDLLHAPILCSIIPAWMLMLICTVWFLSLKGIFSWEHGCVCLGRGSHGQRFQSFLLIQTWKQVHLFLWTNYSPLLNVVIFHISAAYCHSKTRCTYFSVHTKQLFLATTNFSCCCLFFWTPNSLHKCSECNDTLKMSQYMHHLIGENFYFETAVLSWLHSLMGHCGGRES